MSLNEASEILDEILGPIRFDDGKTVNEDKQVEKPHWIARPDGWDSDSDFELYISGDSTGPDNHALKRAKAVFACRAAILSESVALVAHDIESSEELAVHETIDLDLIWIDCCENQSVAVFHWEPWAYVIWKATLDAANQIIRLKRDWW